MASPRRRIGIAAAAIAVVATGGALAWSTLSDDDSGPGCDNYAFPQDAWRAAMRAPENDEALTRRLARSVVQCELVIGKTRRDVRALLGPPDQDEMHSSPRHREWIYDVGLSESDDVSLYMEYVRGRVVYVTAPQSIPGGSGSDISAGAEASHEPR